uniref:ARAD1C11814p n=1 Tax=Blastobotrys adeninivorans TaxID=409370 RepID=A0A060T5F5_BLAAD
MTENKKSPEVEVTVYGEGPGKDGIYNADDELLAQLGYRAELKRNFSVIEVFGIAFSIMSLMPSIAAVISYGLMGGPVGMTWGWLVPSIFILSVGVAMGELGSALPTSGGLYWWSFRFSPEKIRKPLCFLVGYSNTLGLIGGTCSITYGGAAMLLSIPSIVYPDYAANDFQVYGVFVAMLILEGIVASVATKIISRLQTLCIFLNALVIILTVVALPLGAEELNSAKYVFTDTSKNYSGWPIGWAFFFSWMSAIWTIGAFDSCVHMAEEASNAARAVPLGIVMSISMCGILGFVINAVIVACIPDFDAVLNNSLGQPMAYIYLTALGEKWTIAMMVLLCIVQFFMGVSIVVAASRQSWAFTRDGALPFSKYLRVVNHKLGLPLRALWFVCGCSAIVGMLCMINEAASSALFSLACASNSFAWLAPIACRAIWFKKDDFTPGPFYLGHTLSRINCFIASVYLLFVICVLAMFPSAGPEVDKTTMNYTCVINGAVWIGCLLYYAIDGRKWFTGPKSTLDEMFNDSDSVELAH